VSDESKPETFEIVAPQTKARWRLDTGEVLKFTPDQAGEEPFEIWRTRSDALRLDDGAFLKRMLVVQRTGGKKTVFQLPEDAFDAVVRWLAPRHTELLRRELLRRLLTLAIFMLGTTVFWPFGWLRLVGVTVPLVAAYAIGVLVVPHRAQVFVGSAAMAVLAAMEGYAVAAGATGYHYVQLALTLLLVYPAGYQMARRLDHGRASGLYMSLGLAAVAVVGIGLAVARGITPASVEGVHRSDHLGVRIVFPTGWYDGELDETRTLAPGARVKSSRFLAGANLRTAHAFLDVMTLDGVPPKEETDGQLADSAKKFFGELTYLQPAIESCQIATLRGQRAVRCTGKAKVPAMRDAPMQLLGYADDGFHWAVVYITDDASRIGEGDAIAGSVELLE
jgi:hypothetical protein